MLNGSIGTTRRARRGMLREWRLHALSVFSLAVAFVCLGAALLVLTNLRAIEERWSRAGRASIYLKDNAPAQDVEQLKTALSAVQGIVGVRYVSPAQARQDFGQTEAGPKAALAALPVDAFPASLEIEVRPDVTDSELESMVGKLKQLPAVDDVETYQAWTERLSRLIRGGVAAAALLALVVFASVLAVVGSTIRLALQRRRTEVEVLKLVGASDRFIKGPFLVEGSAQGALGAAGAVALLAALFFVVRGRLDAELAGLVGVEPSFLPWYVVVGMIGVGMVLGTVAALLGLRRLVTV
ncbi:Cell division protein FtsX [Labilithrix luteola]|uniref:Cell division protein FtsX n=1 Tax=Labilithrix luteola TaxID=1391654 RepID=A0A0K1PTK9_9BACT|nr:permease-like cell division protein FtsX [Labilithrix luteola]AKU96469.1 Cell division protein FtsX [Labilithrix luteola]